MQSEANGHKTSDHDQDRAKYSDPQQLGKGGIKATLEEIGQLFKDKKLVKQNTRTLMKWDLQIEDIQQPVKFYFSYKAKSTRSSSDQKHKDSVGIMEIDPDYEDAVSFSYVLYLKHRGRQIREGWVPWLQIKPSSEVKGKLGVFTMREFKKGDILGWMELPYTCIGSDRNEDNSDAEQERETNYFALLSKLPIRDWTMEDVFCHLQDPAIQWKDNTTLYGQKFKLFNVQRKDDGRIYAMFRIGVGQELFLQSSK